MKFLSSERNNIGSGLKNLIWVELGRVFEKTPTDSSVRPDSSSKPNYLNSVNLRLSSHPKTHTLS